MFILNEDVQVQFGRQTAIGAMPGVINGILMPRGSSFSLEYDQKLIDNPQVFADGLERDPAFGNKTSGGNGDVVPNLAFLPWLQKAIAGNLVTTGTGPYVHTSTGISRTTLLHWFELGFIPATLYYKWLDMVLEELHLKCTVEGILSVGTKWHGSGNVVFPPTGVSADSTPTEITGSAVSYMDALITENGIDGADIVELDIDIVRKVHEKRPSGKAGVATELRCGTARVSGMLKVYFESDARWLRARNGTVTPIVATLNAGTDSSVITLTECRLQPVGPKEEGEDGILQTYAFKSVRKTNLTDTPLKIVTTCGTATVD